VGRAVKYAKGETVNNYDIIAVGSADKKGLKQYIVKHECGETMLRTVPGLLTTHRGCSGLKVEKVEEQAPDLSIWNRLKTRFIVK